MLRDDFTEIDGSMVGAARGIEGGPESDVRRASRPVNTTRAAKIPEKPLSEKERVYRELDRVKAKCFRLREELRAMHAAFDKGEIAALRAERDAYKKALSNIAHRLDTEGEIDVPTLRNIVFVGLDLKNIRPTRQRTVRRHQRAEAS